MATSKTEISSDAAPESTILTTTASDQPIETPSVSIGSIVDSILKLLSSVRFGLIMLGTLLTCCMLGMIIMQVNVEGFQKYYLMLSPAQRAIFGRLGFFEIYTSWYFTLLLAVTGLNIILASIDRFPTAWQYLVKPKLNASPKFVRAQMFASEANFVGRDSDLIEAIKGKWKASHFKVRVSTVQGRTTLFAQRYVWNRLGAYVVHVALLTIFTGGFLTARYGAGGSMEIEPGRSADRFTVLRYSLDGPQASVLTLPFKIECLDLKQELIRPEGGLDAGNTIDWLSSIKILDDRAAGKENKMLVHLNNVGNYRGYRFFQSQFSPVGNAREITVVFEPVNHSLANADNELVVRLGRQGSNAPQTADLPGIGKVSYVDFYPDFDVSGNDFITTSGEFNRPVAQLDILDAEGKHQVALALGVQAATDFLDKADQQSKDGKGNQLLYNGYRVLLRDFEKVSRAHTLTIQYDPGRTPVYIGFVLLFIALCSVFFFSHQRVWAVLDPSPDQSGGRLYIGGNVNRNRQGFEETFKKLAAMTTATIKQPDKQENKLA